MESAKNNQKTFVRSYYCETKVLLKESAKAVLIGTIFKKILGQRVVFFFEKRETLGMVFSCDFCEFCYGTVLPHHDFLNLMFGPVLCCFFFLFQFILVLTFPICAWVYVCVHECTRERTFKVDLHCIIYMTVMV